MVKKLAGRSDFLSWAKRQGERQWSWVVSRRRENVDYQSKRLELASESGTYYNQAPLPACTCGKPAVQSGSACQRRQQKMEARLQGATGKAAHFLSTTADMN